MLQYWQNVLFGFLSKKSFISLEKRSSDYIFIYVRFAEIIFMQLQTKKETCFPYWPYGNNSIEYQSNRSLIYTFRTFYGQNVFATFQNMFS